jgi:hypothetical protein
MMFLITKPAAATTPSTTHTKDIAFEKPSRLTTGKHTQTR